MAEDKFSSAIDRLFEKKLVQQINQRDKFKRANQSKWAKGLGYFGAMYYAPLNILRNIVRKEGVDATDIMDTTTEFSGLFEARNPSLLYNRNFQDNKFFTDFATSILFDPITYASFGTTALGRTAGRVLTNLAPLLKNGKAVIRNGKIVYRPLRNFDAGKKFDTLNFSKPIKTTQNFTRVHNPKLWDEMEKVGAFEKALEDPAKTFRNRVDQGYTELFGTFVGGKNNAFNQFTKRTTLALLDTMGTMSSAVKNSKGFQVLAETKIGLFTAESINKLASSIPKSISEMEEFDKLRGTSSAENFKALHDGMSGAKILKELNLDVPEYLQVMTKIRGQQALKKGLSVENYMASLKNLDALGQTAIERTMFYDYMQYAHNPNVLQENGKFIGDIYDFSQSTLKSRKYEFNSISKEIFEEYRIMFDHIKTKSLPSNKLRSFELNARALDTGTEISTQLDYALGNALKIPVTDKILKANNFFSSALKIAKGLKQKWRGLSVASKNLFRKQIHTIMSSNVKSISIGQKKIASMIRNEKIAYGSHTINDLIKHYDRLGLAKSDKVNDLIKKAMQQKNIELADQYLALKETVELINDTRKLDLKNGFKWGNDILNTPLNDVFTNVRYHAVEDFYNLGIPFQYLRL